MFTVVVLTSKVLKLRKKEGGDFDRDSAPTTVGGARQNQVKESNVSNPEEWALRQVEWKH